MYDMPERGSRAWLRFSVHWRWPIGRMTDDMEMIKGLAGWLLERRRNCLGLGGIFTRTMSLDRGVPICAELDPINPTSWCLIIITSLTKCIAKGPEHGGLSTSSTEFTVQALQWLQDRLDLPVHRHQGSGPLRSLEDIIIIIIIIRRRRSRNATGSGVRTG